MEPLGRADRDRRLWPLQEIAAILRGTLAAAAVVCLLASAWSTWLTYWASGYGDEARVIVTTGVFDLLFGYANNTRGTALREVSQVAPLMVATTWIAMLAPVGLLLVGAFPRLRRAETWALIAGGIALLGCACGVHSIGFDHVPWTYHPQVGAGLPFLALSFVLAAGFARSAAARDRWV